MANPMTEDPGLAAARRLAREIVRERFPDLAGVEPRVSRRHACQPHPADIRRLGVEGVRRPTGETEYTFTFAREIRTDEGYTLPRIARITVDAHHRLVKAVLSK